MQRSNQHMSKPVELRLANIDDSIHTDIRIRTEFHTRLL